MRSGTALSDPSPDGNPSKQGCAKFLVGGLTDKGVLYNITENDYLYRQWRQGWLP